MHLIVGLGNPGDKYKMTRHNIGFRVLDLLAPEGWTEKYQSQFIKLEDVILAKPQTFMNESGKAVKEILKFYPDAGLIVVHDELDLPLGSIRIQKNVSAAGHNGIKSIINEIGTQDFIRVRVGIRNDQTWKTEIPSEDYVLQNFTFQEDDQLVKPKLLEAKEAIELIQTDGFEAAQNKFNG
jgi:PTH1 family peptidyl-tRNA hydrolase